MNNLKEFSKYYIQVQENLNIEQNNELLNYVESASDVEVKALLLSGSKQQVAKEEILLIDQLFEVSMNHICKFIPENFLNEISAISIIDKLSQSYAKWKVPNAKYILSIPDWYPDWYHKLGGTPVALKGNKAFQTAYKQAQLALSLGTAVGASVIAAMVILIANKAYMSYLSKAAKACKGKSGKAKNNCFQNYYINSIKAEIEVLENGKPSCDGSKNPNKCKFLLDVKIKKKRNKIEKLIKKFK